MSSWSQGHCITPGHAIHKGFHALGKALGEQGTVPAFKELSVQWEKDTVVREVQYRVESHKTAQSALVNLEGGHLPSLGGIKGNCLEKAAPENTPKKQTGSNQATKRRENRPG